MTDRIELAVPTSGNPVALAERTVDLRRPAPEIVWNAWAPALGGSRFGFVRRARVLPPR